MKIRNLGLVDYQTVFDRMQAFTAGRIESTPDELWLLQHPPVYTLGLGARDGHLHQSGDIPVVRSDRGGQVTYHGPGQLIVYVLLDLKRRGYGVRSLVQRIEQALIDYLAVHDIIGERRIGAPGIYVAGAKVAALGLRVRRGCSYHGLSLNIDMDLTPFGHIDPCGYPGLAVTQLKTLGISDSMDTVAGQLVTCLDKQLQYESDYQSPTPAMETVAHD